MCWVNSQHTFYYYENKGGTRKRLKMLSLDQKYLEGVTEESLGGKEKCSFLEIDGGKNLEIGPLQNYSSKNKGTKGLVAEMI